MKRGISPLLAYVFLVALVVSVGMMVASVLIERARQVDLDSKIDYCDDVSLSVTGVCVSGGIINISISNNGAFSVYKVTLGKETNVSSLQSCVYPDTYGFLPIKPGEESEIPLSLNATFIAAVNESLPECHAVNMGVVAAAEISIVPWIRPEPDQDLVACTDQKIVWNKNLNVLC